MLVTPRLRRSCILMFLGRLAILAGSARAEGTSPNLDRLRAFPLERRQALARGLQQFDTLPAAEQAGIRELDRRVNELPDEVRIRYLSVLHRYHLWLRTLNDDQRKELQAAPPEQRMSLVRKLAEHRPPAAWGRADQAVFLGSTLNLTSVFDQAYAIRVWLGIEAADRKEVGKLPARKRQARLVELGRQREVPDLRPPQVHRIEELVRDQTSSRPQLRKALEAAKPQAKAQMVRRLAEARFLANHEPPPVEPRRLERFVAALPGWLLEPLDGLPPEPARRRLGVLYRLAFPDGEEMPDAARSDPPATGQPVKAAAPSANESSTPF